MSGYREVFRQEGPPADPGKIFYTITSEDAGKSSILTTAGNIYVGDIMGRILPGDAGKRVYRVPVPDDGGWIFQVENDKQRDERMSRER